VPKNWHAFCTCKVHTKNLARFLQLQVLCQKAGTALALARFMPRLIFSEGKAGNRFTELFEFYFSIGYIAM
jgi:hypothetical protein